MIVTENVLMKISVSNMAYWRSKGYAFANPAPRWGIIPTLIVQVVDLEPGSNYVVDCVCDDCGKKFKNRYCRNTDTCHRCFKVNMMKGNTLGSKNRGKKLPQISGKNHPHYNPNKPLFQKYASHVRWLSELTYREYENIINPNHYPRTLCGINGGWQLDHIISIKEAFDRGLDPKSVARKENLQMLPWQLNRAKAA